LSSDYFELPEGTRILVQALLLKQLESENFVNQFNAIHSLTVFANSFEDYINSHAPSSSEEPEEDDFEKAIRISREEAKKRNFEEDKAVVPPVKPVASPVKPVAPPVEKKKAESVISSEPAVQEDQPSPQDIRIKVLLLRTYLISEDEVSDCMQALKTQKSWKDAFTALKAYDDSTKDYSAKGLIAFIAEGSKSDAILSAFRNQAAATAVLLDQTKKDEKLSTKASRP
jgi:hypothetical protein